EMAKHGSVLAGQRGAAVRSLSAALAAQDGPFPSASLDLDGDTWMHPEDLSSALGASRRNDVRAGRTLVGPHRDDLIVRHREKDQDAARASTGEQKALLIGITLAHAALVAADTGRRPILLLDEVAAHLDEGRRAALFALLDGLGAQVWMTGTDAALFRAIPGDATYIDMADGAPVIRG
ncbi:MAG: DNA replication and repair protein RecF, partial [Pacificimonas sp.]